VNEPNARTVSVHAIALRAEAKAKWSEQQALMLQDELIIARQQIEQLTAELEHLKAKS